MNMIKIKMFCKLKTWATKSATIQKILDSSIDYM